MRTLREFVFSLEILASVLTLILMLSVVPSLKRMINNDANASYQHQLSELHFVIDRTIAEKETIFSDFFEVPNKDEAIKYLKTFTDIFEIDEDFNITRMLRNSGEGLIFEGYNFGENPMTEFLLTLQVNQIISSPIMQAPELDSSCMFIGGKSQTGYLVARFSLDEILAFIEHISANRGVDIAIVNRDNYVLTSTGDMYGSSLLMTNEKEIVYENKRYLVFREELLESGNFLVLIASTEVVDQKIRIINQLMIGITVIIVFFFLIKIILLDRFFTKPIKSLVRIFDTMGQGESEDTNSRVFRVQEINKIFEKFLVKNNEVSHYLNQLQVLNDELEYKVKLRTKELEETMSELVEAEKMASLGLLVAGVAHEINTPVGVCVTTSSYLVQKSMELSKLLQNDRLTKKTLNDFLNIVEETSSLLTINLERTVELIDNFKNLAAGLHHSEYCHVNLKKSIQAVTFALTAELNHKNAFVQVDVPENFYVYSSQSNISHIFTNLILNSLQHGYEASTVSKKIMRIKAWDDSSGKTILYQDNGIGINKNLSGKVFEPFFTTRRGKGNTGLGLSIVYNILGATGDEISVCEGINGGAGFLIRFVSDLDILEK